MSDEYLWDRSAAPGEMPDELLVRLECELAPLREEGDAMLDELLAEALREREADEQPLRPAPEHDAHEAVVVPLPTRSAPARPDARPTSERRWIWWSVAAGLLLTISALVLVANAQRRREPTTLQVGGGVEPLARVQLGVRSLSRSVASSKWPALVELRSLHRPLAQCAKARVASGLGPIELSVSAALQPGGITIPHALRSRSGELDEPTRACVTQAMSEWRPTNLGAGELNLLVTIEAGAIE